MKGGAFQAETPQLSIAQGNPPVDMVLRNRVSLEIRLPADSHRDR
jgi:hypothetical protein